MTYIKGGTRNTFSRQTWYSSRDMFTKSPVAVAFEIESVFRKGCPTITAKLADITSATIKAPPVRCNFPVQSSTIGTGCRLRESPWITGRMITSTMRDWTLSVAEALAYTERRPIASVNGLGGWMHGTPDVGLGMESFRQRQRRQNQQRLPAENDACLTRTTISIWTRCERPVLAFPFLKSPAEYKDNEKRASRSSCTKKWSSGTRSPAPP